MNIIPVTIESLTTKAAEFKAGGYRLVQIHCTRLPSLVQVNYSFHKGDEVSHLRLELPDAATPIPSISGSFWGAFPYENEMHDLFGLKITDIAVDYKGSFYKTTIPQPFATPACMPGAVKPKGVTP